MRMTHTYPLELPFRGERNYLHGTDLYQAITTVLGSAVAAGPLSLTFHSLLQNQPDLVCSAQSLRHLREDAAFRGELRFGSGEQTLNAVLMESLRPVAQRKACNENEVAAAAAVDETERTAVLELPNIGTPIELVVFLNKHMHLRLLPHLSPKWLFARLELSAPLPAEPPAKLFIQIKQVLGSRFTRSDIFWDGQKAGSISFSTPQ
jgi:hypothetical protein